ncbi:putative Mg(2+) transport ATPase [Gemmata sp. SH-PL17]|uniref:MgtC/SapB family protein n=1 Tax=Gemmata sp. SH-PL17 TaxID=1630693 RepID=UPI00078B5D2B|nr:MgtC/SapB family protein [Gemmata sp. SH-PL17]AMV24197.1 putative Mg(2+) transport ATPase [Gemmata sp. SH-PL17]
MGAIVDGVVTEFSDLSAVQAVQLALRLGIAAVLGGLIGRDREKAGKAAGVRTYLLVSVGAAAFVAVPQQSGATAADVTRILQGLAAGMGRELSALLVGLTGLFALSVLGHGNGHHGTGPWTRTGQLASDESSPLDRCPFGAGCRRGSLVTARTPTTLVA